MLLPWFILVTVYGACVGSFLNVVIYRLPLGKSLVTPPSSCPSCGHFLAWYDNVPVFGWLWLRGRCRYCRAPISVQYPLIEALTAVLFGGLFAVYYYTNLRWGFATLGLFETWPVLVVHLCLVAALLAATVIDARLYIIPLQIPWTAMVIAVVILPAAAHWYPTAAAGDSGVMPWAMPPLWGAIGGAVLGLLLANGLLAMGLLPRSFAEDVAAHDAVSPDAPAPAESSLSAGPPSDPSPLGEAGRGAESSTTSEAVPLPSAPTPGEKEGSENAPALIESNPEVLPATSAATTPDFGTPEQWLAHPHPRREMLKECLFLLPAIVGGAAGYWLTAHVLATPAQGQYLALDVLAGVLLGYLAGGGIIWLTRIGGTFAFGKEAMGLGDVHLLAAIGAVVGATDSVLIFFVAPFLGIFYALLAVGVSKLVKGHVRVIPYGPFIAAATVIVMILRGPILGLLGLG
ncbi:MAG: prepilin peptidase [Phycisphaeraceae bacterium]